jgi:hypothetical protein
MVILHSGVAWEILRLILRTGASGRHGPCRQPLTKLRLGDFAHFPFLLHRSDVHEKFEHPLLAQRAVVYYCDAEEASFTNSVLMLAAYLLLIHGHTAQDALLPFARIVGLPIKKYRDATW